jgi:glycosyltransferase involved in cell wall biosynthesis
VKAAAPATFPRHLGLLIESDGPGGAEQVVAHLAEHFSRECAMRVTVFVPSGGEGWLAERLRPTPVEVEAVPMGGPLSPHAIMALVSALRRHEVDLLHTHEFGQALGGASAASLRRIPHLITMHGGKYFAERKRRRAALRLAISLSGAITAVSSHSASHLEENLGLRPGTVLVLPNGAKLAPGEANGTRARLGIPPDVPLALAVGNLYPVKGHRHLVEALSLLTRRHPDLHVAIAGRGEEDHSLRSQARAAGVADRLHLLGLRADVGTLLRAADLFVHPSLAEGLPLAVIEAMLAARPIVASAVGEIPKVLNDGEAGLLVPPADPAALASGIAALITAPERARELGARAAARAGSEYAIPKMAERYLSLYGRLLTPSAVA